MHEHLDDLKDELPTLRPARTNQSKLDRESYEEFAAPFSVQLYECLKRVFSQYWRTPSYIYSKSALSILTVRTIEIRPKIRRTPC